MNALLATRVSFCSPHPQGPLALIFVQLDIGKTLQITFVQTATFLVHNAQVHSILNAPLVVLGTFYSLRQPHALVLVQLSIGRILQITFAYLAILLV